MNWTRMIWIRTCTLGLALAGAAVSVQAEPASERPTFYKDVLPIFQENCQACHRPGGNNVAGMVAPFSLMTYNEARPWAKAIAKAVETKIMPPWYTTDEFHGVFSNERVLTEDEIATVVRWANTGAPRGNDQEAPAPVSFQGVDGWMTGKPDLIVRMPQPYFVEDSVNDEYASFTTTPIPLSELPADRWIKAIEWRGDSNVVHHIVGSASVETPEGEVQRFELGSIAPGEEGTVFPAGYGKLMKAGSRIHFSMHYHKEPGPGTGKWDQSMVGFQFWDEKNDPKVVNYVHRNGISARYFEIPPGHPNWEVSAARTFDTETEILSLHPHMHLRGKDAKYIAIYPDGRRETLLWVPNFDFNWQLDYFYKEPKVVPAGTRIEYIAHYDNSADNIHNPDPTIPMVWGGPTTMEMMIGYISYSNQTAEEVVSQIVDAHEDVSTTSTD